MENNYVKIKKVITQYLKTYQLSKISYLTNCQPNKYDNKYLLEDFNYICFCLSDYNALSNVLFLKYKYGYKKIPFDVMVGEISAAVHKRPFGYIWFTNKSADEIEGLIQYISSNKDTINKKYPILLRISSIDDHIRKSVLPENCHIAAAFSPKDLLIRIEK